MKFETHFIFSYHRLPENHFAYHQSPSTKMAGVVNPRKLIKAQQSIAKTKFGCAFIEGQVDKIARITQIEKEVIGAEFKFVLDVKRYFDSNSSSAEREHIKIKANRIILATGVYTNILPKYQVNIV